MRFGTLLLAAAACAAPPAWVEQSNAHAKLLLDALARSSPESAAQSGIEGIDERITDPSDAARERRKQDLAAAGGELRKRRNGEKDPKVRQDLDILIEATAEQLRNTEINEKYFLPYSNAVQAVFGGIRALLDDQISPARRPAAVVRLRRYTGLEKGYRPLTEVLMERFRKRSADPRLQGPFAQAVEQHLAQSKSLLDGMAALFARYKVEGYQEPLARFREQAAAWNQFVLAEVVPRARRDFRLPNEVYENSLRSFGVDIPAAELARTAHQAFDEIQKQMDELAPRAARDKGITATGYRDVIRALKKQQITGDAILPHYKERIAQLEQIARREKLITIPARPSRVRLATPAESAVQPAPNMRPPRLLGNTGESGEFVLPLANPNAAGEAYDDFTFEAASWMLAAHEARPGHELQYAALVEGGVSTARALFAFNSTNVEGWGLYAEAMVEPFLPAEGQLIILQSRLLRAARAFLDPELQAGKVTPAEARRVLEEDAVFSRPMARQEVDRYTFRAPGQATSYFYGYLRLRDLRAQTERRLGAKFDAQRFHDFILAQGLLPPALLKAAVEAEFSN